MLDEGVCGTVEELAKRKKVNRGYMSRVLRLTLLTPDVVEAILDGRQPEGLRLEGLLDGFPVEWEGQTSFRREGQERSFWANDLLRGEILVVYDNKFRAACCLLPTYAAPDVYRRRSRKRQAALGCRSASRAAILASGARIELSAFRAISPKEIMPIIRFCRLSTGR